MVQRKYLASATLATGLALGVGLTLSACTSETPGDDASTSAPAASASATPTATPSATPDVLTTQGALVKGWPEEIEQLPDSEIVSSSIGEPGTMTPSADPTASGSASASATEDSDDDKDDGKKDDDDDKDDGLINVSLVMRTDKKSDEAFDFYTDSLGKADFEPVGDLTKADGVETQAFQKDDGEQIVTVAYSADPDDKKMHLVTVGGVIDE